MRRSQGDSGTFGEFRTDSGLKLYSGELPWRGNKPQISCVVAGVYVCKWQVSKKHGWCYHLIGVPGRSACEIHSANWMGDIYKLNPQTQDHYKCQLEGCIALGNAIGPLEGQDAVLDSRDAIERLVKDMTLADGSHEDFQLIIHDIVDPVPDVLGGVD